MIADEVDVESEALHQLPVSKLHERFVSVYGEAPRSRNRVWLIRKILWRLQSLKGGSLSERARQRATELAADADVRLMPAHRPPAVSVEPAEKRQRTETSVDRRLPSARTPIYRDYKGKRIVVHVKTLLRGERPIEPGFGVSLVWARLSGDLGTGGGTRSGFFVGWSWQQRHTGNSTFVAANFSSEATSSG